MTHSQLPNSELGPSEFLQDSCHQRWLPCDRGRAGPSPSLALANESPLWLAGQPFISPPGSAFCKPRLGWPGWPPAVPAAASGEVPSLSEKQDQSKRRGLGVLTPSGQTGQPELPEWEDKFILLHGLIHNLSSLLPAMARAPA